MEKTPIEIFEDQLGEEDAEDDAEEEAGFSVRGAEKKMHI